MELPRVATRARIVALAALVVAVVVVVVLLLARSSYHVDAVFTNASQLVLQFVPADTLIAGWGQNGFVL